MSLLFSHFSTPLLQNPRIRFCISANPADAEGKVQVLGFGGDEELLVGSCAPGIIAGNAHLHEAYAHNRVVAVRQLCVMGL